MRYILIACVLLFATLGISSAQENQTHIHIVYVEPAGEAFETAEQDYAYSAIADAVRYWNEHTNAGLVIADTQVITTGAGAYNSFEWSRPYFMTPDVTIFVLDNSLSGTPLFDNAAAQSQTYYKVIWAALRYSNSAVFAHEFGHILYQLRHHYEAALDIMSLDPYPAYQRNMLGCATLAELGEPCKTVYLPIIIR